MSFFSTKKSNQIRTGGLIEIGSGSVVVSVIVSSATAAHPDIIWSQREFATTAHTSDADQNLKSMLMALMNAMMALDNGGGAALRAQGLAAQLQQLQISISAPWAFTISQIIRYERDDSFTVTTQLINELVKNAESKTTEVLANYKKDDNTSIAIMTRAISSIAINDYVTMNPVGQTGKNIALTQISAVAQTLLTTAVDDLRKKLYPKLLTERYSTMILYHCIARELYPSMTEYCLIDLTYEATELAIIRDGVLQYTTHTNIGINTLVRNFAQRLQVPEGDARTLLKNSYEADSTDGLKPSEKTTFTKLMNEYEEALEQLFHETGDALSIPKVIFLHGNTLHEQFFDNYISAAAKAATSSVHTIHNLSQELLAGKYTATDITQLGQNSIDTSTLLAAQFFHKQDCSRGFVQL